MSYAHLTSAELQSQVANWQRDLGAIRRLAAKTLSAYLGDLGQFLTFLASHTGGEVGMPTLKELRAADIRAFLASRRNDDIGSRSLARELSAIKSFFGYLEREGILASEALATIRTPKQPRSLPKALTVLEARATITTVDEIGDGFVSAVNELLSLARRRG